MNISKSNEISSRALLYPHVELGSYNKIFPFSVIGAEPQMYSETAILSKIDKDPLPIKIGNNNIFREFTTVHSPHDSATYIGDSNILMAYSHVAHDVHLLNNNKLTNNTQIAGYCKIDSNVYFGLSSCVQQRSIIGSYALLSMNSTLTGHFPPFSLVHGNPGKIIDINARALRKLQISNENIKFLKNHVIGKNRHQVPEVESSIIIECWLSYHELLK